MCTLHMYRVRITKAFIKKFHLFHNMPHYNIYNYYYYYCYYVFIWLPVCAYETGTFQIDICDVTDAKNLPNANGTIKRK